MIEALTSRDFIAYIPHYVAELSTISDGMKHLIFPKPAYAAKGLCYRFKEVIADGVYDGEANTI